MARLRSNNVFGTVTDAPLTAGATTLNAAGLANLAAVSGSDVAVITLDPNRVNGAPEIVHVTAHTGSATSATILRGREGTSAREHPADTFWVHAATVTDWGDWAPWTPTFTNFTLGNGTVAARFIQAGETVDYHLRVVLGSTSLMGTGPRFTLPVATLAGYGASERLGDVTIEDTGTATFNGVARVLSSTTAFMVALGAAATVVNDVSITVTAPMIWVSGDVFSVVGTYEV